LRVLVSGSSGLIGSALVKSLRERGDTVVRLVRSESATSEPSVVWDPQGGKIDPDDIEGYDAAIHLAGSSVAEGRWTAARKAEIRSSRVLSTLLLCDEFTAIESPPKVLLCASAIGYYGDRGEELLVEDSAAGRGFLSHLCKCWEGATSPASQKGIRVVNLRFGLVLSPLGGALKKMLGPFEMGLGGVLGSGEQYMSWVTIDDAVAGIVFAMDNAQVSGPINLVSPSAVTNREFTRALARVVSRPAFFKVPGPVARLVFGEAADELLLSSARVCPKRLMEAGFDFAHTELEPALRHLLA
jgi:uncharacterized protein